MSVAVLLAISLGSLRIMERGARAMAKIMRTARHSSGAHAVIMMRTWSRALPAMKACVERLCRLLAALLSAVAFLWASPFLWTLVASFRPESAGSAGMASLCARLHADARRTSATPG